MQAPRPPPRGNDRRGRRNDGRQSSEHNNDSGGGGGGGLAAALVVGAGLLVVAGVSALLGWNAGRESEAESNRYYTLPPRSCSSNSAGSPTHTYEGDRVPSNGGSGGHDVRVEEDDDCGGPRCVVCRDRPQRFMFVQCHHICLCESCLIHMGRDYEDAKLHGRFDGPVRLACPVCRQVGYVVKTYAS